MTADDIEATQIGMIVRMNDVMSAAGGYSFFLVLQSDLRFVLQGSMDDLNSLREELGDA